MLTAKELERLHCHFFETAKRTFLEDGHLRPLAFFVFDDPDPVAKLESIGLYPMSASDGPENGAPIAVVPLAMDARTSIDVIARIVPTMRPAFELMRKVAPAKLPGDEPLDEMMLRTFLATNKLVYPDLIARYLSWAAERLDAYALYKADECWLKALSEKERREDYAGVAVRDMPGRRESILVTFESRTSQAAKSAMIVRETPGDESSKAIGYEAETTSLQDCGGRFFDLLRRAS